MFLAVELSRHENIYLATFELYTSWLANYSGMTNNSASEIMVDILQIEESLFRCNIWIIPIHQHNHYQLLCIIFLSTGIVRSLLFDSMSHGKSEISNSRHILDFIKALLHWSKALNSTFIINNDNITLCYPEVHQQTNTDDCGIYTILNGIHAMKNKEGLLRYECINAMTWYNAETALNYRKVLYDTALRNTNEEQASHMIYTNKTSFDTIPKCVRSNTVQCPTSRRIHECVTPWTYIGGDVLNYFFHVMMQNLHYIKVQPTYFFQRLHMEGGNWSLYEQKWVGRHRDNHNQFLQQVEDKNIVTVIPMGHSNHWTILVKIFIMRTWVIRFADSISHSDLSSLHHIQSIFEGTPLCNNEEPICWEDVKFQPQTEFECGARICIAAVILSLLGNRCPSECIRKLDEVTDLSIKAREFVRSICETGIWRLPEWLDLIINN